MIDRRNPGSLLIDTVHSNVSTGKVPAPLNKEISDCKFMVPAEGSGLSVIHYFHTGDEAVDNIGLDVVRVGIRRVQKETGMVPVVSEGDHYMPA